MSPPNSSERSRPALKPRFHRLRQARRKRESRFDTAMDAMQCDLQDIVAQNRELSHGNFMVRTRAGVVQMKS
jgi:hypothetical protein